MRCRRWAIAGGTVCPTHGGQLPQVRAKAQQRLRELQHPAVDRVERVLVTSDDDALALRAATIVFDRTGLGPTSTQDVNVTAQVHLAALIASLDAPQQEEYES